MSDMRWLRLDELTEPQRPITYGVVKPGPEPLEGGITLIRGGDIANGRIATELRRITEEISQPYRRTLLKGGELVMSLVGNPGSVAIVPEVLRGANLARQAALIALLPNVDARYVMYWFMSPDAKQRLAAITKGAVQQVINLADLKRVEVPCPPLETQRRIASILGAYDDLIEVNRRRIAVLEEMARGLFDEWFVRFRFPGHKSVPIEDTPNGPLPKGWTFDALGKVAAINAASLKPTTAPAEIGYIDIASVSPGQINAINYMPFSEAPGRARRLVRDGSILWSNVRPNRRSFALVLDPAPEIVASTGFTVLDARKTSFTYLYHWVTTENFIGYLVGNAQGAAYPAVIAATFERATVLLPHSDLVSRFTECAEPMLRLSDDLRKSNQYLAAARDLLLPRLISGQLSVAQAERELEDA